MKILAPVALTVIAMIALAQPAQLPRFEDYAVKDIFSGTPAQPVFTTAEQRRFQTRIKNGVTAGGGVWTGSWKDPIKSAGPNFAGHYYVIRWGCGSQCLTMAIVDAQTGKVYNPPLSGKNLEVFMDPLSEVEIDFKPDSSLMILRNGCKAQRTQCGVYCFNWQGNRFVLVQRTLGDLTKAKQ